MSAPDCRGRTPGPLCPPTCVPLDPRHARLCSSEKPLVALMTYDGLIDDTEATLGQVQRFLVETGQCDNPAGQNHPPCHITDDPQLPAGGLDWCAAYDSCQWDRSCGEPLGR